jgi:hypothetical protein
MKDVSNHHIPSIEDEMNRLLGKSPVVDPGPSGVHIPQVQADPVIVKTNEFCDRMRGQIQQVCEQMEHRASLLEAKAKELRTRSRSLQDYGANITGDMRNYAEMLTEYHHDAQSLEFVGPKGE